jgi:hypothetical protein
MRGAGRRVMGARRGATTGRTRAQRLTGLFRTGDVRLEARSFTPSGGNVLNLVDLNDPTHTWAVTGTLPAPIADAGFGGALALAPSGTQFATSNRAPSTWKPWTNGAGSTIVHGYRSSVVGKVAGCANGSAAPDTEQGSAAGGAEFLIRSAFGVLVVNATGGNVSSSTYTIDTHRSASTPQYTHRLKSVLNASGSELSAPSAADPPVTMQLFAFGNGSTLFTGTWCFRTGSLASCQRPNWRRFTQASKPTRGSLHEKVLPHHGHDRSVPWRRLDGHVRRGRL